MGCEVRQMNNNPFQFNKPVIGDNFYGRDEIIKSMLEGDLPFCWVRGSRRSGKTSLLRQIESLCKNDDSYSKRYIPAYLNFEGVSDENGLTNRFIETFHPMKKMLGLKQIEDMKFVDILYEVQRCALKLDRKILFLCDETSSLLNSPHKEKILSYLINNLRSKLFSVVFADIGLLHDVKKIESVEKSALEELIPPKFILSPLEPETSLKLVQKNSNNPVYNEAVNKFKDRIMEHTNNIPFFLQLVCSTLYGMENINDFDEVLEKAYQNFGADVILGNDLHGLQTIEQKVLLSIVEAESSSLKELVLINFGEDYDEMNDIRPALYALESMGYINIDSQNNYFIKNYFLKTWYKKKLRKKLIGLLGPNLYDTTLITKTTEPTYLNKEKPTALPFAIKQLQIENFNGIKRTGISNIPVDARWIFLTGENGFGKTSVLQAIVANLYGIKEENKFIISDENKVNPDKPIKIGIEYIHENRIGTYNIETEKLVKPSELFEHFVAYGPSRLNLLTSSGDYKRALPTYSIFNTDGLLWDVWYKITGSSNDTEAVIKLFEEFLEPYIQKITRDDKGGILYHEADTEHPGKEYKPVRFKQLASGFRSVIATVGDLLVRLIDRGEDITNLNEIGGLVIIDEIDLHWHPKMQYLLVKRLSELFPKMQFIVSTHSILPILGAPKDSIFLKVDRNKEDGIFIEKVELNPKELSPNIILSSPLFDYPVFPPEDKDKARFPTDDSFSKWRARKAVEEELNSLQKEEKEFFDKLNTLLDE
jgi:hypothetical protein